ncbi:DNA cytosine methyltransferase [uncultured Desulfuromonas sp.]|uniref:DNA cytosine methyltransferase n=1 Tax=uncultured Desulfuromonas sp. TaxID=181013 RepID=UPI002AAAEC07|nr:DNA cytosine methyltransferase [uncultured Desulfuromonas sp.]
MYSSDADIKIEKSFLLQEDAKTYGARCSGDLLHNPKRYRLIDLFCGAGGMSLGFSKEFGQPFQSVWANDFNQYCVDTYNANFGKHCIAGDIVQILENKKIEIPKADVVIGGPPCQGFSLLNKNRDNDPRKELWRPYLEVVKRSEASIFVMENVPQLLGTFEHGEIVEAAKSLGFTVWQDKLIAADYGVPQTRTRAFIIGCKFTDPSLLFPPRKTHAKPSKSEGQEILSFNHQEYLPKASFWRTVKDAIGDLPAPVGTEIRDVPPPLNLHFGRNPTELSKKRYRAIPHEGMNRFDLQRNAPELTPNCWLKKKSGGTDLFGRLWWDRPSVTVRTEFFKPEKGRYLHPEQHRPITHREAARFQSFPDKFEFQGSKVEIAKQIGNAVPPLLAARVADVVRILLSQRDEIWTPSLEKNEAELCRA